MTMQEKFAEKIKSVCEKYKDKTFITYMKEDDSEENWTYKDFWKQTKERILAYKNSPIRKGNRILVMAPLSPYVYAAVTALAVFGAVSVIINPELPEEELDFFVRKSEIRGIVCDAEIYRNYAHKWEKEYPVFDIKTSGLFINRTYPWTPSEDRDLDVLTILYSSGTTSEPKGVMITYEAQMKSAELLLRAFGTNDIRYLLVFPMFHVSGFSTFFALFLGGAQIGLLENANSVRLMQGFQKYNPNTFGMVPKVYETIQKKIMDSIKEKEILKKIIQFCGWIKKKSNLNLGKVFLKKIHVQVFGGNMKYLCVGGGKCSKEVSGFFQNMGYYWMNTYASTEMNLPMITTTVKDRFPSDSVGKITAFPEISVRIQNPDANGIGEVQIKTPCHMKGYFRDEKATEEAYEEGYFKTGDLGYCDSEGYLYITGRSKESIHLRNGEKISPEQMENLYAGYMPENAVAACVGVPIVDAGYDEVVFFVEKSSVKDTGLFKEKIKERSKELGGDYRIDEVRFVEKIPLSSIGKVQRYKLREQQSKVEKKKIKKEKKRGVFEEVKDILQSLGIREEIEKESILEDDLGIDSLNLFELCVEIEKHFGEDLTNCISAQLTIEQLCEMVDGDRKNSPNTISYDVEQYPMKRRMWDRGILSVFRFLTKVFYKFKVSGTENIPQNGAYIICANHQSHLDGMWILAAGKEKIKFNDFCCMAKQEHLNSAISRRGLRLTGGIPVARGANTSPALKRVLECLEQGKVVLIHPEGTRTVDGKLGEFKLGAEKLALEAKVPILPVKIEGAYEIYPKNQKLPHILRKKGRYPLKIKFFPTLNPQSVKKPLNPSDYDENTMFQQLEKILKGESK